MMRLLFLMLAMISLSGTVSAQGLRDMLTVDLAQDHVDITTGFNGARLSLFGVQDREGNIAIVITGPERDMVVRRKRQVAGIWANTKGITFSDVPSYYDYALSVPEEELTAPVVLGARSIGIHALRLFHDTNMSEDQEVQNFQKALIRNKQEEGLFPKAPKDIVFLNDRFFRASFDIPANVPTGDYQIRTFLFQQGAVKDIKTTDVRVAQVGTSARIYRFAHGHSITYGALCVLFAMLVGWFSDAVRRRL